MVPKFLTSTRCEDNNLQQLMPGRELVCPLVRNSLLKMCPLHRNPAVGRRGQSCVEPQTFRRELVGRSQTCNQVVDTGREFMLPPTPLLLLLR